MLSSTDMQQQEEQHAIIQPENGNEPLMRLENTDFANAEPDFTNKVFGNPVLFHRLVQYLDIPDLKILRQTCKLLLSTVTGLRNFTSNLQITVSDKNIDKYEIAMGGTFVWKNVNIDISSTSPQHFPNIPTELIEDLDLTHPFPPCNDNALSACYELLESRQFPNLRSLGLDLVLLRFEIPISALSNVVGMGRLKDFRLIRAGTHWGLNRYSNFGDEEGIKERNLEIIGGLPWKLRSIDFRQDDFFPPPNSWAVLGRILASSVSTLESIKVYRVQFGDIIKAEGIRTRFPRLRNIRFTLRPNDSVSFAEFLRLQPPLESMYISIYKYCSYDLMLDPAVLDAIKSNAGSKLHTLHLVGVHWSRSFPELNSWGFIPDLPGVRDFTIDKFTTVETVKHLPPGMEGIRAKGLNCQEGNSGVETLSALIKFSNLLRLDLDGSIGLVNDAALQSICTELTNLRLLRFGSTELTDFGITGESGDNSNSGVSLRDLRGLRDLMISPCGSVSVEGLLKTIQFSELRRLQLGLGVKIPTLALIEMAANNPSLKLLSFFPLSSLNSDDTKKLVHHLVEVCPRFVTLIAVSNRESNRGRFIMKTGIGSLRVSY